MQTVKLLVDVAEGGRNLAEAKKAADAFGLSKASNDYPRLKTVTKSGKTTAYTKGQIVTMHEASAAKWVAAGLCEILPDPSPEDEAPAA